MNWPSVSLKDCCSVIGGATPKRNTEKYWSPNDIPWITPKDISGLKQPVLEDAPEYISKAGFDSCATYMLPKGAVLLTSRAPIGNVAIAGKEMCTNQGFKSLVPGPEVDSVYLYYCMLVHAKRLDDLGNGATFKEVSKKVVESFEIPLPPIGKQKRIAAILDKADNLRRKRRQATELADQFLNAVFLDMFGALFTNQGYETKRKRKIGDLVSYIDYRGKTPEKSAFGVPLVTAKNVKKGHVSVEPREFVPEENYLDWMSRGLPKENDVLFTTEAPLGNVALLGKYEKVVVGQRLISLRSLGEVTHEYLMHALLNRYVQGLVEKRSSGSTVKGIRTKEFYEIEIPVPCLNEQTKFSEIYWKYRKNQEIRNLSSVEADAFFNSLCQKAFSGEL